MQTNFRNAAVLVLLAGIAATTWYFGHRNTAPSENEASSGRNSFGYYLRDAVLLGTDETGTIVYRVSAAFAQEQPGEKLLSLQDVRFAYQPAEQIPWRVSANHGTATTIRGGGIDFTGNVELIRAPNDQGSKIRIQTEHLHVDPPQHLATAPGPVRVSIAGHTLTAVGLKAFLKENRIELESHVHGLFVQ